MSADSEGAPLATGSRPPLVITSLPRLLEALLVATDAPLDDERLAVSLGISSAEVTSGLAALADAYDRQERGFRLRRTAAGWRLYADPEQLPALERIVLDEQPGRLTQAALETLAIVAYQQPVSRGRVAAVRGVSVDSVMRALVGRGLVSEVSRDDSSGAVLYGTTQLFLEKLGLSSLVELPALAPLLPDVDADGAMTEQLSSAGVDI